MIVTWKSNFEIPYMNNVSVTGPYTSYRAVAPAVETVVRVPLVLSSKKTIDDKPDGTAQDAEKDSAQQHQDQVDDVNSLPHTVSRGDTIKIVGDKDDSAVIVESAEAFEEDFARLTVLVKRDWLALDSEALKVGDIVVFRDDDDAEDGQNDRKIYKVASIEWPKIQVHKVRGTDPQGVEIIDRSVTLTAAAPLFQKTTSKITKEKGTKKSTKEDRFAAVLSAMKNITDSVERQEMITMMIRNL